MYESMVEPLLYYILLVGLENKEDMLIPPCYLCVNT